jgi:hypothetical protein
VQVQSNRHANCVGLDFPVKEGTKTVRQTTALIAVNMQPRYAHNQMGGTKLLVKKIYCQMEQHAEEIVWDASHLINQPKLHKCMQNSL